jgi:hypothetical protein
MNTTKQLFEMNGNKYVRTTGCSMSISASFVKTVLYMVKVPLLIY